MALLARYAYDNWATLAVDPLYYDREWPLLYEDIVGWNLYYAEERYCSLNVNVRELPVTGVQQLNVYQHRKNRPGTYLSRAYNGRDRYPIPGSDRILEGSWDSMINHARIAQLAGETFPPPWFA